MKNIILILGVVLFTGCFGGFGEPVDNKKWGDIEGRILNIIDGKPIGNVDVRIGDLRDESDDSGFFAINLEMVEDAGNTYSLTNSNYNHHTGKIIFSYGQKNIVSYICPKVDEAKSFVIRGTVGDGVESIEGVNVTISGVGYSMSTTTDKNGYYFFSNPAKGKNLSVHMYKNGYSSYSEWFTLDDEADGLINYNEIEEDDEAGYAEIEGIVGGKGGAYAKVSFGDYYVIADNNGGFEMEGIPIGERYIKVRPTGFFEEKIVSVTVEAGGNNVGEIEMESTKGE